MQLALAPGMKAEENFFAGGRRQILPGAGINRYMIPITGTPEGDKESAFLNGVSSVHLRKFA